jgi:hypothetical protein
MLDEKYAAELERLQEGLTSQEPPTEDVRHVAEEFIRFAWSDPQWPKLYFEFTAYAARNTDFRQELLTRDRKIREQMAEVYRAWSEGFGVTPPVPVEDLAMMTFCMANGFLMGQLIEPDLGEELYGTMMATFFRGLVAGGMGFDADSLSQLREAAR